MAEFAVAPPAKPPSSPGSGPDHRDLPSLQTLDAHPSASSPFPSPSSSFLPPPMPGAHEFANKPPPGRNARSKKNGSPSTTTSIPHDENNNNPPTKKSDSINDASAPAPSPNGIPVTSADADLLPSTTLLDIAAITPVTPTPGAVAMTPTSSTQDAPPQVNSAFDTTTGSSTPTQIQITLPPMPSPSQIFAVAPSLVRTPSGSGSGSGSGTASKHTSLSSSRPAPASPVPSRRQSGAPSLRSRHRSGLSTASVSSSKLGTIKSPPIIVEPPAKRRGEIRIRDFAFPVVDARHTGRGPDTPKVIRRLLKQHGPIVSPDSRRASDSSLDSDEGSSRRSSGFGGWAPVRWATSKFGSWGFGSGGSKVGGGGGGGAYMPSQLDFERNFDDGADVDQVEGGLSPPAAANGEELSDECEEDDEEDGEGDGENEELLPGLYRALYDFEPEGTAEMGLKEGQIVRIVGRGGGVGWAIAVKPGVVDEGGGETNWALVPESYLKVLKLDEEMDEDAVEMDTSAPLDDAEEVR